MGVYFREKEWGWDKEKDLMGAYFRFNISKGWDRVGLGVGLGVGSEVGFESGQERYKSHRWDYQILSFLLSKKIGWGWGWDWVHISEILYQTTRLGGDLGSIPSWVHFWEKSVGWFMSALCRLTCPWPNGPCVMLPNEYAAIYPFNLEHPCPLCPHLGLQRTLEVPDRGLESWSWFGYGPWSLIHGWSKFWPYLGFEGAKNLHVIYVLIWGFGGCWMFLTGSGHLDLNRNMVTGLWYTHVPYLGSLSWFWRCKEHLSP